MELVARDERGFTLVELLVVMLAGTVIVMAIMAMLDVTIHQTSRTFSKVSATQNARIVTETIENELHSACVGNGITPIQAGSDGNDLMFISQYGSTVAGSATAAVPTPVEHKIVFAGGALTDYVYPATNSSPPWTFASSPTPSAGTVLVGNVSAVSGTPVFQYFAYTQPTNNGTPYTDSAGNTYMMIQDGLNYLPGSTTIKPAAQPLDVGSSLNDTDAGNTSEVLMTFNTAPATSSLVQTNLSNVNATVQDQIVLRMTPPANHAGNGASFTPCA